MGFEGPSEPLSNEEKEVLKKLETDTLDAIERGDAIPMPSFIQESRAARQAFQQALGNVEELRESLAFMPPAEKVQFLEQFNAALTWVVEGNMAEQSTLESLTTGTAVAAGGLSLPVGLENDSRAAGIVSAVVLLAGICNAFNLEADKRKAQQEIKDLKIQILDAVSGQ